MFKEARESVIVKYSRHWELLDPVHRVEHFDDVFNTAVALVNRTGMAVDLREVFVVAYFHDLFTWSRSNHHLLAETFIRTTSCPIVTSLLETAEAIDRVALACRESHGSWTDSYSSDLSRLMNAAIRGAPRSPKSLLDTAIAEVRARCPAQASDADIRALSVAILKVDYGRGADIRVPNFHLEFFAQEYEAFWVEIDAL